MAVANCKGYRFYVSKQEAMVPPRAKGNNPTPVNEPVFEPRVNRQRN